MALNALFFYGTLRHVPLLECVLGRPADTMKLVPASLDDHAVYWVRDQPFPMIATQTGEAALGLILHAPTADDIARLDYYEGAFDYDLSPVTACSADGAPLAAHVYFPEPGLWPKGEVWSLDDWIRDWGDLSLRAATEAMAGFGRWSPQDLARRMPMMRRRAAAACAARARGRSPDHRDGADAVRILTRTRPHTDFFALHQIELTHPRYDGSVSEVLNREVFFVGDAVSVLPYDPVRDAVLLTEQFRPNVWINEDPSPWVIEPVSGLVDPGETPETGARREAMEEAGVTLTQLDLVAGSYSSTGASTEFVTMYVGLADFGHLVQGGGLETEGEDIRRIILPFEDFAEGLRSDRFRDMPLVAIGLWLMLHRDRLRALA